MNRTLFPANNVAGKWYVNDRGIPAALDLKTATVFPTEATRIEDVSPGIVAFAALSDFTTWSGSGSDPRTFHERSGGAGGRRARGSAAQRPPRPAIDRETCTHGIGANAVGRRVRATSPCVLERLRAPGGASAC